MDDTQRQDLLALVTSKPSWSRRDFVAFSIEDGWKRALAWFRIHGGA